MSATSAQASRADLIAALRAAQRLQSAPDVASFRFEAVRALRTLVPCDHAGYNEIDTAAGTATLANDPAGFLSEAQQDAFRAHMGQHPVLGHVARTGDREPLTISDFIGRRRFHRLDLYDGVFRPSGLEHQVAMTLRSTGSLVVGVSLNRSGRDFGQRDREILRLLSPHLSLARQNAELRQLHLSQARAADAGPGIALLSAAGPVMAANAPAERLLGRYLADPGRRETAERWIASRRAASSGDLPPTGSPELELAAADGVLTLRFLAGRGDGEPDAIVLSQTRREIDADALAARDVTPREVEILRLAARGLTNADVAAELQISPATVKKHLENVYRKLGAGGRMAAVARARELSAGRF